MKSKLISVAMLTAMFATPVSTALADTEVTPVQPTVEAVNNGTNADTKLPDDTKVAYTINVNLVDGSGKTLATIPASVKDSTEKLYRVRSKALYDRYNEYLGKEFSEGQIRYKASEIHQDVQRVLKDGVYVYTDNINVKVEPASTAKPAETPKANTDKKADTAKPAETDKKADAPKTSEAPKVDTAKKADTPKVEAPKVDDTKKAEDAKQTDQTPKADTTKPADQTPAQKDGDSDRVVYVANNGNANAYWVNKSNMPANTNLDTVREMSEKEAIKLGKHQADAEVLAEKHQADKAQADDAKKDDTVKIDGNTAQTDTAKKDDTAKADDTKKTDTAKTDTAKTADSKANATNLPKTNDTASLAMPAFGTALMAIGAFFGFKRKNAE